MTQTINPLSAANFTQDPIDETVELGLDPNSRNNSKFNNSNERLIGNNGQVATLRIVDEDGDDQN